MQRNQTHSSLEGGGRLYASCFRWTGSRKCSLDLFCVLPKFALHSCAGSFAKRVSLTGDYPDFTPATVGLQVASSYMNQTNRPIDTCNFSFILYLFSSFSLFSLCADHDTSDLCIYTLKAMHIPRWNSILGCPKNK